MEIDDMEKLLRKRNLEKGGIVQQYIDNQVLRRSDQLVPLDKKDLKSSGIKWTTLGSGEVVYKTPYARKMYYNKHYNFQDSPTRGAFWFERMKASNKQAILQGAIELAGGKK